MKVLVAELGAGQGTHVEECEMLTTMPIKGIHVSNRFRGSLEVTLERWLTTGAPTALRKVLCVVVADTRRTTGNP